MAGNLFFTSDEHYGHASVLLHCPERAAAFMNSADFELFYQGLEDEQLQKATDYRRFLEEQGAEMNRWLIANHNAVVQHGDKVIHLGDFSYKAPKQVASVFKSLRGSRHALLRGNHDDSTTLALPWNPIDDAGHIPSGAYAAELTIEKQKLLLCHYAHKSWNRIRHGAIHLYGHSHANLYESPYSAAMDVGVDNPVTKFAPMAYEDIKAFMQSRLGALANAQAELTEQAKVYGFVVEFPDNLPAFQRRDAGGQLHDFQKFPSVEAARLYLEAVSKALSGEISVAQENTGYRP